MGMKPGLAMVVINQNRCFILVICFFFFSSYKVTSQLNDENRCKTWEQIAKEDQDLRTKYRDFAKSASDSVFPNFDKYRIDLMLLTSGYQVKHKIDLDSSLRFFKRSITSRGLDTTKISIEYFKKYVPEIALVLEKTSRRDEANYIKIKKYLQEYGYPNIDKCIYSKRLPITVYQIMGHHMKRKVIQEYVLAQYCQKLFSKGQYHYLVMKVRDSIKRKELLNYRD